MLDFYKVVTLKKDLHLFFIKTPLLQNFTPATTHPLQIGMEE